ncbi:MAG TPA: YggU family protein [Acidimicrobiaceae bacterium]|nr:YggU family protein [Acidimicrobiaceae bacterium]
MGSTLGPIVVADGANCRVRVRVQPGARRSEVMGVHGDELRVRIASPPVDGRANDALCAFLASVLGVKSREVEVVGGHVSRSKVLRVGASVERVCASLASWIGPDGRSGR